MKKFVNKFDSTTLVEHEWLVKELTKPNKTRKTEKTIDDSRNYSSWIEEVKKRKQCIYYLTEF